VRIAGTAAVEWPDGAEACVSLTFDVDVETPYRSRHADAERRLSQLSEGRYGIRRGLPRVLELLAEEGIPGTFFVPGRTALDFAEQLRPLAGAGHEVGHHGHDHADLSRCEPSAAGAELAHGLEALERGLGVRPLGYRAPHWTLTPETLELLWEHDFVYDSSLMEDDRPYLVLQDPGDRKLVEFPVHWSLDDYVYFGYDSADGGRMAPPGAVMEIWMSEVRAAAKEGRHLTLTMHPECIGRPYRLEMLAELIRRARREHSIAFMTLGDVARLLEG
jgi:peptidoglycan/xylan/chitin deacetylase (PgdA/CDA1 family)